VRRSAVNGRRLAILTNDPFGAEADVLDLSQHSSSFGTTPAPQTPSTVA
jgi:hypothetical protein